MRFLESLQLIKLVGSFGDSWLPYSSAAIMPFGTINLFYVMYCGDWREIGEGFRTAYFTP